MVALGNITEYGDAPIEGYADVQESSNNFSMSTETETGADYSENIVAKPNTDYFDIEKSARLQQYDNINGQSSLASLQLSELVVAILVLLTLSLVGFVLYKKFTRSDNYTPGERGQVERQQETYQFEEPSKAQIQL